jgi:hypothetical protein
MILVLTRKGDGLKILVNVDSVKLFEPDADSGTHVVFGADLVRVVSETLIQIKDLMEGGSL